MKTSIFPHLISSSRLLPRDSQRRCAKRCGGGEKKKKIWKQKSAKEKDPRKAFHPTKIIYMRLKEDFPQNFDCCRRCVNRRCRQSWRTLIQISFKNEQPSAISHLLCVGCLNSFFAHHLVCFRHSSCCGLAKLTPTHVELRGGVKKISKKNLFFS